MFRPFKMLDTSNPGTSGLPAGYKAVAGYIGGDTPHVWTKDQWARFKGVPKLPIYVARDFRPDDKGTHGTAAGIADGWDCLHKLFDLGVKPGVAVAYDIETSTDANRVYGFAEVLNWAGFKVWLYGSRSTVLTIPFPDYWVADYTNVPHWSVRSARAEQYQADVRIGGVAWDVSNVRKWQIRTGKLWV